MTKTAIDILKDLKRNELEVIEKLHTIRDTRLRFAIDHHVNTRGDRMDFTHYPHIRDIYNSLARDVVLQGSVQSFKSEWAIIDHFAAAYSGMSVFFVIPKYDMRTTYVQNRVNRCVEHVAEYKKIIGEGFFDSVALKSFGSGVIKYVGSNVLADFKEFPADMVIVEEVDECDADNVEFALDRLRASKFQFTRYLGNPKIKGKGINKFFESSDQREWFVPCIKCGEFAELDWFKSVVQDIVDDEGNVTDYILKDRDWSIGCGRDVKIMCPQEGCGGELERASNEGLWIPSNPRSAVEGYHISMLCSPINSVAGMWTVFQAAQDDPGRLKQFFNSYLGLPFNAVGNKVTETILDNCVDDDFDFAIRPNCGHVKEDRHEGPCSMGVDVGGVFDVRISYIEARGKRRAVFMGKVKHVDELHELIDRYNIEKCVMDSMPEITLAQDFQDAAECDVWLCRYGSEGSDRRRRYDVIERMVHIDRTEALDRSFAALRRRKNILPANYAQILDGEYVSEICYPVRQIVDDTKGNSKYEWSRGKDHQRHCDTYDYIASELLMENILDDVVAV